MAGISINILLYAGIGGVLPTFLWLWFWLAAEDDHQHSKGLFMLVYIGGMLGVMVLLPLKPLVQGLHPTTSQVTVLYAALEELTKFLMVALIAFSYSTVTEPTDYTIYLVTGALGFSALENTLYLINPLMQNTDLTSLIATGNLRFFGATVLHTMSVAIVGIMLGLAYSSNWFWKFIHTIIGLALAITLHTAFNYFIMQGTRQGTTIAIAGIWSVVVVIILIFDRLKTMEHQVVNYVTVAPSAPTNQVPKPPLPQTV